MEKLGHQKPFGYQGQPRKTVRVVQGCGDAEFAEAVHHNMPLLMRGCIAERSPRMLDWDNAHLTRVAGHQKSRFCHETLARYLERGMPYYRNCGELPKALLEDVRLPTSLAPIKHKLDNAVLWSGNVSYFGRASPL